MDILLGRIFYSEIRSRVESLIHNSENLDSATYEVILKNFPRKILNKIFCILFVSAKKMIGLIYTQRGENLNRHKIKSDLYRTSRKF